jgi:hypothetical protein
LKQHVSEDDPLQLNAGLEQVFGAAACNARGMVMACTAGARSTAGNSISGIENIIFARTENGTVRKAIEKWIFYTRRNETEFFCSMAAGRYMCLPSPLPCSSPLSHDKSPTSFIVNVPHTIGDE